MNSSNVIILLLLFLVSCGTKQQKFKSEKWNNIDGTYNLRDLMVEDLMNNILHYGMKYQEVIELLGKPNENKFNPKISYEIYYDFMTEERRLFTIHFSSDSTVLKYSKENFLHK